MASAPPRPPSRRADRAPRCPRAVVAAVVVLGLLAGAGSRAAAQCETVALVPYASGSYGHAVDVAHGRALIGDHEAFDGVVFVYHHESFGWSYATALGSSDPDPFTFGYDVAVAQDALLIGAPNEDGGHGRVHVFEPFGPAWIETTLLDLQTEAKSALGGRVVADGTLAAAAAIGDSEQGGMSGAVHVLEQAGGTWTFGPKLVASDPNNWARFGTGLALHDGTLVAGAPGAKVEGTEVGAAYVFERQPDGGWLQTQKLLAPGLPTGAGFGNAVALHGDRLLVAAWLESAAGAGSGQVHAFRREPSGAWVHDGTLTPAATTAGDRLGFAVALDGELALVSSWAAADTEGRVTVFRCQDGAWIEGPTLASGQPSLSQGFGWDLALDGDLAVVGAHAGTGSIPGAAFLWGGFAPWEDLGGALPAPRGPGPTLQIDGALCPGQALTVTVGGTAPTTLVTLVLGFEVLGLPFAGGTLVPSPDVLLGLTTDGGGHATLQTTWPGGLPLGTEVVVQAWAWPDAGGPWTASAGRRAAVP